MRKMLLAFVAIGTISPGLLQAAPLSYMGSLTGGGQGLTVTSTAPSDMSWYGPSVKLEWRVDNTTSPGWWHYQYTITTPSTEFFWTDIQCVIVETSPTFGSDSLRPDSVNSIPPAWLVVTDIGLFTRAGNPGLWNDIYGLKFCTENIDPSTLVISFDSDRAPVWGDFYARSYIFNGHYNALINDGLGFPTDTDPSDPAGNGSIRSHVLVPDSVDVHEPVIPAPGAVLLGTLGASLTGLFRRRRWL